MVFLCCVLFVAASAGSAFADELRDIKPPLNFPFNYLALIIIAAILLAAALGVFIYFWLKKKRAAENVVAGIPLSADQIAYQALEKLKAKNLPAAGKLKEYYSELSAIVRRYVENRFSIRAPEMTTEEFLAGLSFSGVLSGAHKNILKEFLQHCDLVKFARYGPLPEEVEQSFNYARRFIDETKPVIAEKEQAGQ